MGEASAPLEHRAADLVRLDAVEVPFITQIDVRCDHDRARALGFPLQPNTASGDTNRGVLWLAPDEWLVVALPGAAASTLNELSASLFGTHHAIVDVSANRAVIDLRGADRLELLASGCSLDLDARGGWVPGACAQTLFARAQVIVQELPQATRLFVRPSFADYVVDRLLVSAGIEPARVSARSSTPSTSSA
jgi:sarcosine oxidase, subunit gamma